jgi:hypothetical protein
LPEDCDGRTKFCKPCIKARNAKSKYEAGKRFYARLKEQKLVVRAVRHCAQCGAELPINSDARKRKCNACVHANSLARLRVRNHSPAHRIHENKRQRDKRANDAEWRDVDRAKQRARYDSAKARNMRLLKKYGMTQSDYGSMLEAQGGRCAICGRASERSQKGMLYVDHDHVTGKVRGLLCGLCNSALGDLGDSIRNVERALSYLAKHHQQSLKLA